MSIDVQPIEGRLLELSAVSRPSDQVHGQPQFTQEDIYTSLSWALRAMLMVEKVDRRKRVAVAYHFFPHYRAAVLHELLNRQDFECILVSDVKDPHDSSIEPWTPPRDKFVVTPCKKLTSNVLWQVGLIRVITATQFDVIIFLGNFTFLSTWVAAMVARLRGTRVLFWTHGWLRDERGIKGLIRSSFYRLAHGLLLYGNRAKQIAVRKGFRSQALYVIYNSLDYKKQKEIRSLISDDRLRTVRSQMFPRSSGPILVCTGRLTKLKQLDLILHAMTLLKRQGHEVSLLLVGDGPEREYLETLSVQHNLAVHFYGACYEERQLAELIMCANVAVSPGQVGLTAMHALAYGVPVITHGDLDHQMPECEAILPGRTGDTFQRGNVQDLANVLKAWVLRPWPDPRTRLECAAVIEQFYNPDYQATVISRAVFGAPAE